MQLISGTRLGKYEIRAKLGEGGMGEVYLAQDTKLDRKVALKILPAEVASQRDRMERFVRPLGFVPAATLKAFYRAASLFAFPSLYEGFGLAPLEAMLCGTPVVASNLREITDEVLATLTPREEKVIKMRFGLGTTGSEHTLEEVGQHFAVTRERIRQIEAKALRKLRHPSRSRKLKAFLETMQH